MAQTFRVNLPDGSEGTAQGKDYKVKKRFKSLATLRNLSKIAGGNLDLYTQLLDGLIENPKQFVKMLNKAGINADANDFFKETESSADKKEIREIGLQIFAQGQQIGDEIGSENDIANPGFVGAMGQGALGTTENTWYGVKGLGDKLGLWTPDAQRMYNSGQSAGWQQGAEEHGTLGSNIGRDLGSLALMLATAKLPIPGMQQIAAFGTPVMQQMADPNKSVLEGLIRGGVQGGMNYAAMKLPGKLSQNASLGKQFLVDTGVDTLYSGTNALVNGVPKDAEGNSKIGEYFLRGLIQNTAGFGVAKGGQKLFFNNTIKMGDKSTDGLNRNAILKSLTESSPEGEKRKDNKIQTYVQRAVQVMRDPDVSTADKVKMMQHSIKTIGGTRDGEGNPVVKAYMDAVKEKKYESDNKILKKFEQWGLRTGTPLPISASKEQTNAQNRLANQMLRTQRGETQRIGQVEADRLAKEQADLEAKTAVEQQKAAEQQADLEKKTAFITRTINDETGGDQVMNSLHPDIVGDQKIGDLADALQQHIMKVTDPKQRDTINGLLRTAIKNNDPKAYAKAYKEALKLLQAPAPAPTETGKKSTAKTNKKQESGTDIQPQEQSNTRDPIRSIFDTPDVDQDVGQVGTSRTRTPVGNPDGVNTDAVRRTLNPTPKTQAEIDLALKEAQEEKLANKKKTVKPETPVVPTKPVGGKDPELDAFTRDIRIMEYEADIAAAQKKAKLASKKNQKAADDEVTRLQKELKDYENETSTGSQEPETPNAVIKSIKPEKPAKVVKPEKPEKTDAIKNAVSDIDKNASLQSKADQIKELEDKIKNANEVSRRLNGKKWQAKIDELKKSSETTTNKKTDKVATTVTPDKVEKPAKVAKTEKTEKQEVKKEVSEFAQKDDENYKQHYDRLTKFIDEVKPQKNKTKDLKEKLADAQRQRAETTKKMKSPMNTDIITGKAKLDGTPIPENKQPGATSDDTVGKTPNNVEQEKTFEQPVFTGKKAKETPLETKIAEHIEKTNKNVDGTTLPDEMKTAVKESMATFLNDIIKFAFKNGQFVLHKPEQRQEVGGSLLEGMLVTLHTAYDKLTPEQIAKHQDEIVNIIKSSMTEIQKEYKNIASTKANASGATRALESFFKRDNGKWFKEMFDQIEVRLRPDIRKSSLAGKDADPQLVFKKIINKMKRKAGFMNSKIQGVLDEKGELADATTIKEMRNFPIAHKTMLHDLVSEDPATVKKAKEALNEYQIAIRDHNDMADYLERVSAVPARNKDESDDAYTQRVRDYATQVLRDFGAITSPLLAHSRKGRKGTGTLSYGEIVFVRDEIKESTTEVTQKVGEEERAKQFDQEYEKDMVAWEKRKKELEKAQAEADTALEAAKKLMDTEEFDAEIARIEEAEKDRTIRKSDAMTARIKADELLDKDRETFGVKELQKNFDNAVFARKLNEERKPVKVVVPTEQSQAVTGRDGTKVVGIKFQSTKNRATGIRITPSILMDMLVTADKIANTASSDPAVKKRPASVEATKLRREVEEILATYYSTKSNEVTHKVISLAMRTAIKDLLLDLGVDEVLAKNLSMSTKETMGADDVDWMRIQKSLATDEDKEKFAYAFKLSRISASGKVDEMFSITPGTGNRPGSVKIGSPLFELTRIIGDADFELLKGGFGPEQVLQSVLGQTTIHFSKGDMARLEEAISTNKNHRQIILAATGALQTLGTNKRLQAEDAERSRLTDEQMAEAKEQKQLEEAFSLAVKNAEDAKDAYYEKLKDDNATDAEIKLLREEYDNMSDARNAATMKLDEFEKGEAGQNITRRHEEASKMREYGKDAMREASDYNELSRNIRKSAEEHVNNAKNILLKGINDEEKQSDMQALALRSLQMYQGEFSKLIDRGSSITKKKIEEIVTEQFEKKADSDSPWAGGIGKNKKTKDDAIKRVVEVVNLFAIQGKNEAHSKLYMEEATEGLRKVCGG